ncbi:MAG: hypothetical protein WBD81_11265, partial [Collimonas pratensis]|uniref:hypothetical protein n=1 Tax=Collimonas pratensis TaxID=279113 RepID=UPI003C70D9DA
CQPGGGQTRLRLKHVPHNSRLTRAGFGNVSMRDTSKATPTSKATTTATSTSKTAATSKVSAA